MRTKLLLTAAALALTATVAHADMLFTIPTSLSEGHMNVRSDPGVNHGLIGAIPGGQGGAPVSELYQWKPHRASPYLLLEGHADAVVRTLPSPNGQHSSNFLTKQAKEQTYD